MALEIVQLNCLKDNYCVLVHDSDRKVTAAIDAPEAAPIEQALQQRGWRLTHILTTHHHGDHTAANVALRATYDCAIIGPASEASRIPGLTSGVADGDRFSLGTEPVEVLGTPGHTLGHVTYVLPRAGTAFVGDTLFVMGCGRLFEGTADMMWASLQKLAALPPQTTIYCGHEYAEANARFAVTIEPHNLDLQARAAEVTSRRQGGLPCSPTTLAAELITNPFMRAARPRLQAAIGMKGAEPVAVFAEIRHRKDSFK